MTSLSWQPIRNGKVFCSPACGARCTHAAFLNAKRTATRAAVHLGNGWKPEVWENLGWHWKVTKGGLEIYRLGCGKNPMWWANVIVGGHQFQATGSTMKAARAGLFATMCAHVDSVNRAIKRL